MMPWAQTALKNETEAKTGVTMITIKDIAKAAGVAQGTVSNVLNGRGNVSSEKIRLVEEACAALGYVPNERAKILRRGSGKVLGVVLTDLNKRAERDFYLSFKAYAESHGYTARQYLPRTRGGEAEEAVLRMAQSDMVAGVAVFSDCYQDVQDASALSSMGILYVERRVPGEYGYLGFDYAQAGRDMAESIRKKGYTAVTLLAGSLRYSNEAEFCAAFEEVVRDMPCTVNVVHTDMQHIPINILQVAEHMIDQAIVCTQLELAQAAKNTLQTFCVQRLPDIYTLSPIHTLPEFDFSKYELNYRLLGNTAAKKLIHALEKGEPLGQQTLVNTGFRSWGAIPAVHDGKVNPINVVTLDSPTAYAMRSMARLYTRQTGIPVNVTIYSYDAIYEVFNNIREGTIFDVLRLDVTWLSWFAHKILVPLTEIDPSVEGDLEHFLEGTPQHYAYVGDTLYALPGTPSTQLLFYRSDLFGAPMYRRMFQEEYKADLKVPETFDEFNRIAAFFTRRVNPASPVSYGATMTLGSTGVAGSEYLARLFSAQPNLVNADGRVVLNSETGVRALEQLLELKQYSSPRFCDWWTDTASAFAGGDVAMAILYNNFAGPLVDRHSKVLDNIGYAMIPGGRPVFGGGSMGVSKYSRQPKEALSFIRWLLSEPIASASTLLGGISPCKASSENYEIINNYPWLKLVNRCFTSDHGRRVPPGSTEPFDERRFIGLIGMTVKNAYSGALSPKEAMDCAQALFDEQFR